VRVEGDLLLLATSGVHEIVRVQISSLGVVMSDADSATKCNIDGYILHRLGVESSLELGAHESISITGVNQAEEMDTEHRHVESDGDNNKAEYPCHHMLGKNALRRSVPGSRTGVYRTYRSNRLDISKQNPQLKNSQGSNPGNCEESNPFDTGGCAQSKTGHRKPKPPGRLESPRGALLMLIREGGKCQRREASHDHERGIEEDQSCLSEQTIF